METKAPEVEPDVEFVARESRYPVRFFSLRRIIASLTLALFCALLMVYVGEKILSGQETQVLICAQDSSGGVTFCGAYVDDKWVSPRDHVSDSNEWVYDPNQSVYMSGGSQPLTFYLPAGTHRDLIFTAGPEAGIAEIEVNGVSFTLPYKRMNDPARQRFAALVFLRLLVLAMFLWNVHCRKGYVSVKKGKRNGEIEL